MQFENCKNFFYNIEVRPTRIQGIDYLVTKEIMMMEDIEIIHDFFESIYYENMESK